MKYSSLCVWLLFILCSSSTVPTTTALVLDSHRYLEADHIPGLGAIPGTKAVPGTKAKRPDFSGTWKLNESKSETGNFGVRNKVCLGWLAAFRTITVAQHTPYMAVDLANPISRTAYTRHEKLIFDGKETESSFLGSMTQKSKTKWAADGASLHVNSIICYPGVEVEISAVWKLIDKGKVIHIRTRSNSVFGENNTDLVYEKVEQ